LGLIVWSLAFGAGHYVQGVHITIATIYGFVFGILYLLRGSLIAPIVAHAAYDTMALLIYWFAAGRFQ
jgi:membrane protease YdiL (CAAX protease family)